MKNGSKITHMRNVADDVSVWLTEVGKFQIHYAAFIISLTFQKLSLAFNLEYLSQFFIKFKDQGQFWNPLVMRIPKLSLIFMINALMKDWLRYSRLQGKAQFPKIQGTSLNNYIFLPSGPHHLQSNTILLNSPLLQ